MAKNLIQIQSIDEEGGLPAYSARPVVLEAQGA